MNKLKSPYPFFGGKSKVANIIWKAFGQASNYVEPFAGSIAVLLANPSIPKIETINDKDCFICNFWRAVSNDPETVIKFADTPIHEADLHARHKWLVEKADKEFIDKMHSDPNYYNSQMAGWWVWGMGTSIGNNWLKPKGLKAMPLLSSAGGGIHGLTYSIKDWIDNLYKRMRKVRVFCGNWNKVVTPSITFNNKGLSNKDITAIFLDPPYEFSGRDKVYREESDVWSNVYKWAIDNGNNNKLRIALCGYEGNYNIPNDWQIYEWKTSGGLANLGDNKGKLNAKKERIYFSPFCNLINDIIKEI